VALELFSHSPPTKTWNLDGLLNHPRLCFKFFYRTVMINWLYTPGMTFKELASNAKYKWDHYYNFAHAPGFGAKDTSESWGAW